MLINMTGQPQPDSLSAKRQVTLVLRLVLDDRGRLERGSLISVSGSSQGHFSGWEGLQQALQGWLKRQENENQSIQE
jgi:hypothetical protein